ncbi:MAG: 4'-phosphopantetheinyl transferase superfamily protein [Deinococcales bacterium]
MMFPFIHTIDSEAALIALLPEAKRLLDERGIWLVTLRLSPFYAHHLSHYLTQEEQQRAERFYFVELRERFTSARAALRLVLGEFLGVLPWQLELLQNPKGKPYIADRALDFNLSHSQDVAMIAFSRLGAVGVDVEYLRPQEHLLALAQRVCSSAELMELHTLNPQQQLLAFYRMWTRKEAFIKCLGGSIAGELKAISVSLGPKAELFEAPQLDKALAQNKWKYLLFDLTSQIQPLISCLCLEHQAAP